MRVDEHLKIVPDVAERLDNPEPTVYVATLRKGVRFHDGHELTSADVVYTFRSMFDPTFADARIAGRCGCSSPSTRATATPSCSH